MNRQMLQAFSQRTVEGLKSYTLFRLALPAFQSFLDINVAKEVEKDRAVIARAAALHQSGVEPGPDHVLALLQEAREIDQAFLNKASVFPIDINIQYRDIEEIRQRRIELLLRACYRIISQWKEKSSFRATVYELYNEEQFRALLNNLLGLYAQETRMLSHSVRIPSLLSLARDSVTQAITKVMKREAEVLRAEATYPDIVPGGSAESDAPGFRFRLAAEVPTGYKTGFAVAWTSAESSGITEPFFLDHGPPNCGTTFSDFQDAQGLNGSYQNYLRVYGREREPCPRCRAPVVRLVQQQRSSFYCPKCQR